MRILLITIFEIFLYMYEAPHHDIRYVFLDTWGSSSQYSKHHIMCLLKYWISKWILHHGIRNIPLYVFRNILLWELLYVCSHQCFGSGSVSGSGSAWFRIKFVSWIRIQVRIPNADPDPVADKISSKSQNNSSHLELFD